MGELGNKMGRLRVTKWEFEVNTRGDSGKQIGKESRETPFFANHSSQKQAIEMGNDKVRRQEGRGVKKKEYICTSIIYVECDILFRVTYAD